MGVFRKAEVDQVVWTFPNTLSGFVLPDSGADVILCWIEL